MSQVEKYVALYKQGAITLGEWFTLALSAITEDNVAEVMATLPLVPALRKYIDSMPSYDDPDWSHVVCFGDWSRAEREDRIKKLREGIRVVRGYMQ